MSAARPASGVSQTTGAPGGADHVEQRLRVDRARVEVGVPVSARVERVARVVAVHQVDPAGDRLHPVDGVREVDAGRVGVAGVEAEPDLAAVGGGHVGDRLPEPRDRVKGAGHRAVAARGVLDEQRQRPLDLLDGLDPVGDALCRVDVAGDVAAVHDEPLGADGRGGLQVLVEQLPARDAYPVVDGRHVDHVRGVDVDVHARRGVGVAERAGIAAGDRPGPSSPAGRRGRTARPSHRRPPRRPGGDRSGSARQYASCALA